MPAHPGSVGRSSDEAAALFQEYADLISITGGDALKGRAYKKAARAIGGRHADVDALDMKGLHQIPDVGRRAGPGRGRQAHADRRGRRTALSLRTIRHDEQSGLVVPSARSQGGFCRYTEADVARLMVIRHMQPFGFTLDEMRALLEATDRLDSGEQRPANEGQVACGAGALRS